MKGVNNIMKLFNKAKNETVNTEEKRNTDATQFVNAVNDAINIIAYNARKEAANLKIRGFETVSPEQILKDTEGMDVELHVKLPQRATRYSAGYDCYAPFDITLEPGEDIKVPTGIRSYMQPGEVLIAAPRSGLGFKYYCRLANTLAVIDSDYFFSDNEGHIFIKLRNEGDKTLTIKQGDGMCQFIFMPFLLADGDSFDKGEKRNGGFGSTTKTEEKDVNDTKDTNVNTENK